MLSRKQFLKELFRQGLHLFNDLTGPDSPPFAATTDPESRTAPPFTEIGPSLLAIEARRHGIPIDHHNLETLQRTLVAEMAGKSPNPASQNTF